MRAVRLYLATLLALIVLALGPATSHALSYGEYATRTWVARYGLDPDRLWNMALCESSGNSQAVGPDMGDGYGKPIGLFQMKVATFYQLRQQENDDPTLAPNMTTFDPEYRGMEDMDGAAEAHIVAWSVYKQIAYQYWECRF